MRNTAFYKENPSHRLKVVYLQCRYHPNMRVYPYCVYEQVICNICHIL